MKRLYILIIVFSLECTQSFAQSVVYRSCMQLNFSTFHMPHMEGGPLTPLLPYDIGISYIRKVKNNFSLDISYQYWVLFTNNWVSYDIVSSNRNHIGEVGTRDNYMFLDVVARYNIYYGRHSNLYGRLGLATASGIVTYVVNEWQVPGYEVNTIMSGLQRDYNFGTCLGIGYNYAGTEDRINIGLSVGARLMTKHLLYYDLNLNVGYNFGKR